MTSIDIEAFLAIVQYATITMAAKQLHVSQPALSKRIDLLEGELGYKLMVRNKGSKFVTLTDKGNAFITIANRWINIVEDTKRLKYYASKNTFRISAPDGPYLHILSNVIKKFIELYPNVNLCLNVLNSLDSYRDIQNGINDIAFVNVNHYYKNIQAIPAYSEKMHFMCRVDSNYPKTVNLETLSTDKMIFSEYSADFESWFSTCFRTQQAPFIMSDLVTQVEDFMTSFDKNIWTIVPASVAANFEKNPMLSYRELNHFPPDRIIYYILKAEHTSEYIDILIKLLKEETSQMNGVTSLL